MRRSARPEDQIQRAVFQHLRQRPAPGVVAFHVPNGGARKPSDASMLKGLAVLAGVHDVIAIKAGRVFALELKAEDGRLTIAQVNTHSALRTAGAEVATTYGLDAAIRQIEQWDLVRGLAS